MTTSSFGHRSALVVADDVEHRTERVSVERRRRWSMSFAQSPVGPRDRAAHSADAVEACIHSISWHRRADAGVLLGFAERSNDLGLAVPSDIAIARKCR
jgi:hypothetical protein